MLVLVMWTVQCALHFTPWQTCSFRHQLNFSSKHLAMLQIRRRLFTDISTTVCSQVLNWGIVNGTKMPKLRNGSRGLEPGLSRLRVRCSTAELRRSTLSDAINNTSWRQVVTNNPSHSLKRIMHFLDSFGLAILQLLAFDYWGPVWDRVVVDRRLGEETIQEQRILYWQQNNWWRNSERMR